MNNLCEPLDYTPMFPNICSVFKYSQFMFCIKLMLKKQTNKQTDQYNIYPIKHMKQDTNELDWFLSTTYTFSKMLLDGHLLACVRRIHLQVSRILSVDMGHISSSMQTFFTAFLLEYCIKA